MCRAVSASRLLGIRCPRGSKPWLEWKKNTLNLVDELQDPSLYDPIQTSSPPIAAERQGMVLGSPEKEVHRRDQKDETEKANVPAEVSAISFY